MAEVNAETKNHSVSLDHQVQQSEVPFAIVSHTPLEYEIARLRGKANLLEHGFTLRPTATTNTNNGPACDIVVGQGQDARVLILPAKYCEPEDSFQVNLAESKCAVSDEIDFYLVIGTMDVAGFPSEFFYTFPAKVFKERSVVNMFPHWQVPKNLQQ